MNINKYNLTFPENNIYLVEKFNNGTAINTIAGLLKIESKFDEKICNKIINKLIESNEALRIKIYEDKDTVYQTISDFEFEDVEYIDMSDKTEKQIEKYMYENVQIPFGIIDSKLYGFKIIRYNDNTGCIFMKLHHTVSDAWTLGQIINQLLKNYNNEIQNVDETLEIPSYIEFISSENEYLNSEKYLKDEEFWKEYLNGINDPISIKETTSKISTKACRYSTTLSKEKNDRISNFCKENKISPYTLFLGALSTYIYRIKENNDFVIGTPILNRSNFREKQMLGMFVSTMPIRMKIEENIKFLDFVKQIGSETMSLFRHQKYPITKTLEHIHNTTNVKGKIYNIMLSYQNARSNIEDESFSTKWLFSGHIQDDLEIHVMDMDNDGVLHINYDYLTDLFEKIEIKYLHTRLMAIIENAINDVEVNVENIRIMSKEEEKKILYKFNDTDANYSKSKTIIQLFEKQVEKTPDNIALVFEDEQMTYRELNSKVDIVYRNILRNKLDNQVIGILLPKGIELIIAILAVIKSNNTYLPIDIEIPLERIHYMLAKSQCNFIITEKSNTIQDINKLYMDELLEESNIFFAYPKYSLMNNLYVIFTSGSTGEPKGVTITQKNIINLLNSQNVLGDIDYSSRTLQFATISFDVASQEILSCLLSGGSLYLIPNDVKKNPDLLSNYIEENKIKILYLPPSYLKELSVTKEYFDKICKTVKNVIVAGEQLIINKNIKKNFKENNIMLYNHYGPSETHVISIEKIDFEKYNDDKVSIGKPILNTKFFILDRKKRLLPIFVNGILCVLGDCVGNGYINDIAKTNERFYKIKEYGNSIIYNTGDLCYYNDEGKVYYTGRNDSQIKINGFRIEVLEIEHKISQILNLKKVVVVTLVNDKNKLLCAYYESEKDIDVRNLKTQLGNILPYYMIPSLYIRLDKLPMTTSMKIDRNKLSAMENTINIKHKYIECNELSLLQNMILEETGIFIEDCDEDMFSYGIDSLMSIRIMNIISEKYNINLKLSDLLKDYTLNGVQALIESKGKIATETENNNSNMVLISKNQRSVFNNYLLNTESILYNMPCEIVFGKKINIDKLLDSLETVFNNNEIFKSYFILENNNVYQTIKDYYIKIPKFNVNINEYNRVKEKFVKPFDLLTGPLFKCEIYIVDGRIKMLFDINHIIFDAYSIDVLLNQIKQVYEGYNCKFERSLKNIEINKEEYQKSKSFYLKRFANFEDTDLETDYRRKITRTFRGTSLYLNINSGLSEKINEFCVDKKITKNSLFMSALNIVLSKYTYSEDIVIGTVSMGRNDSASKNAIGMFVKTLPIRTKIEYDNSIIQFISKVKENIIETNQNDSYSIDELARDLNIIKDNSKNQIFNILYIYQGLGDLSYNQSELKNEKIKINKFKTITSKFDITVQIYQLRNSFKIDVEYNIDLYKKETIKRFTQCIVNCIDYIVNKSNMLLSDIEIISDKEKQLVLNEFNDTKFVYDVSYNFVKLFEERVQNQPDKIAIKFENQSLTFNELNNYSNYVAIQINKRGINKDIIGICCNRSLEMLVCIIGILKSGNGYLPIDPSYPANRIEHMINDSGTQLVITHLKDENMLEINKDILRVNLNDIPLDDYSNLNIEIKEDDIAYMIYTSGSTGIPKGVMLKHKGVTNLINYFNENVEYIKNSELNFISITTMSFDIFISETIIPLQAGLTVVIANEEEQRLPEALNINIVKNNVDIIQTTPSRIKLLIDNYMLIPNLKNVKYIILAGEAFTDILYKSLKKINSKNILFNGYGPTETTVLSTITKINNKNVNIGMPLFNTQILILDKSMKLCPLNVNGELCIAGNGVTIGYKNNVKNNSEKLKYTDYLDSIIYRTGDIAKYNKKGNLEYKGRIDHQVKLHGLRIELEEIENIIKKLDCIKDVIVILNKNNNIDSLVCYYTINKKVQIDDLRLFCKKYLPMYMIPKYFIEIESIPYTPNGKIDKNKLSMLKLDNGKYTRKLSLPSSETEKTLYKILTTLLNNNDISTDDDFSEIGLDSFLAISLQVELLKENIHINYSDIFKYTTVRDLSNKINSDELLVDYNIEGYNKDFSNILEKNKLDVPKSENKTNINGILVTGSNGFLGSHIIDEYLKCENGIVYCLVRKHEKEVDVYQRLKNQLNYFFEDKYDMFIGKKIIAVEGDITLPNLGLNEQAINEVKTNVNFIIHSAAIVKHFGDFEKFRDINMNGTENVCKFCLENNLKLIHCSTISVSGNSSESSIIKQKFDSEVIYDETKFYIGQSVDNPYVYSKFKAEEIVLEYMEKGLKANIIRLGNLTGRFIDGKFQPNVEENAFCNRTKSILLIEAIPDNLLDMYVEFTPIDYTARLIVKVIQNFNDNINVIHAFNNNHVYFDRFIKILSKIGINIKVLNKKDFSNEINNILNSNKGPILNGIINDLSKDNELNYSTNIKIESNYSVKYLESIGFIWPIISDEYVIKYIEYLVEIGFINKNMEV